MKIIGFAGKIGSGKDTTALLIQKILESKGNKVTRLSFANPLKQVCSLLFKWNYDRLLDDIDYKEGNTLDNGEPDPACQMLDMTRRVIMQKVGTECFREGLHSDVWIIALKLAIMNGEYDDYDYGLLTDCRFINEIKFVKDMDGILLKIERTGDRSTLTTQTQHLSETEWEQWNDWNAVIINHIDPNISDKENKHLLLQEIKKVAI